MKQYQVLLFKALTQGNYYPDRTGTGAYGIFGHQMRFDLTQGFPLVTLKRTWMKGVVHELLWMLRGETNIKALVDAGVHIWDEWADENGDLGPVYGSQWRTWISPWTAKSIDQIGNLITGLQTHPFSRRHVISTWNPAELPVDDLSPQGNVKAGLMALAPCHCLFQFHVREQDGKRYLDCQLYQRSADIFLGVPFNIAGYALLTHMVAKRVGMVPGEFIWTGGDCHLYANHVEQAKTVLDREPLALPYLELDYPDSKELWEVKPYEIKVHCYEPHPAVPAPVAV